MKKNEKNIEIRISKLRKEFGDLVAVDDLSLDIYKGEILGILGPNGAGKTTTINMICGLSPSTSGEILYYHGEPDQTSGIKSQLGICPQENIFWPKLTCREQLIFMAEMYNIKRKSAQSRSDQLLNIMGLEKKSNVMAKKLSGGMKKRLSISLAVIHDPDILVLDEPEAGLDPQSRIFVRNFIKGLAGDKTIILTTHNMDEADRLADRVAIIDYGKLLIVNTPECLKNSVGEGDLLEFLIRDSQSGDKNKLINDLNDINCTARFSNDILLVQSKRIIEKVSEVTDLIKSCEFSIREMTMRENTLEDVFIHLTGRKIRQ